MHRKCRYRPCGKRFVPPKPNYWFCCWEHREAHYAGNDYRGHQRTSDQSYDRGYGDGARVRSSTDMAIPPGIWKGLLLFSHPDKWQGEPGLLTLANEVTRWLIAHRPPNPERN
jgi:hypothetical protein